MIAIWDATHRCQAPAVRFNLFTIRGVASLLPHGTYRTSLSIFTHTAEREDFLLV